MNLYAGNANNTIIQKAGNGIIETFQGILFLAYLAAIGILAWAVFAPVPV